MEYEKYLRELDELTNAMSRMPQTVGFVHKFFVPGWIGFIQECFVESKMSKATKQPIYNGMGYYQCADKIVELIDKACMAIKESPDFNGKENDNPKHLVVLASASKAIDVWTNIYPEIAYWMNQKIDDQHVTCALGIVERNVRDSLSSIMTLSQDIVEPKNNSSFGQEMKAMGNQILAMICNILIFAAIASLIGAIFG